MKSEPDQRLDSALELCDQLADCLERCTESLEEVGLYGRDTTQQARGLLEKVKERRVAIGN